MLEDETNKNCVLLTVNPFTLTVWQPFLIFSNNLSVYKYADRRIFIIFFSNRSHRLKAVQTIVGKGELRSVWGRTKLVWNNFSKRTEIDPSWIDPIHTSHNAGTSWKRWENLKKRRFVHTAQGSKLCQNVT